MAVIYDKTLKRRCIFGVPDINKENGKNKWDKKMNKDKNDPKAGADIGKIVNLMAGDANLVGFPSLCLCRRILMHKFGLDLDNGELDVLSLWRAVRGLDRRILPV